MIKLNIRSIDDTTNASFDITEDIDYDSSKEELSFTIDNAVITKTGAIQTYEGGGITSVDLVQFKILSVNLNTILKHKSIKTIILDAVIDDIHNQICSCKIKTMIYNSSTWNIDYYTYALFFRSYRLKLKDII